MRRKIILIMVFILSLTIIYAEEKENLFKDISEEHWAYYSIENLVYKGIIEPTSNYFNGEREVTKNDLAFYLSKVLNKLDEEKVSEDDLLIIENLVYEFSENLNKFSFNIDEYITKIEKINEKIRKDKEEHIEIIKKINRRITELEKKKSKNSEIDKEEENNNLALNDLKNFDLTINAEIKKNESNEKEYNEKYELEFGIKEKNYEVILNLDEKSESNPKLKIKTKKEIYKDINFIFHTKKYRKDLESYYGNVDYSNYNLAEKEYNSLGFGIENKFFKLLLEEDEDIKIINKIETRYLNTFLENNLDKGKKNLEIALKYPLFNKKIVLSSGYTKQETENNKYINMQMEYINKRSKYLIGYEKKDEEEALYNNIYGKLEYKVLKNSFVKYNVEVLDTPIKLFTNHYLLLGNDLKNNLGNLKVLLGINKVGLEKEEVNKELITMNEDEEVTDFNKKEYTEVFAKIDYLFKEKYGIQTSYLTKDQSGEKETVNFIKLYYKLEENNKFYIKYLKKNYKEYDDMNKNINGDDYNMNFNENENIEDDAKDGEFSIGVEFKF